MTNVYLQKEKKDDEDEKKAADKPKAQKIPKITWTAENDRKLLLIMATAPEKVRGEKSLQIVADSFRGKLTVTFQSAPGVTLTSSQRSLPRRQSKSASASSESWAG